MNFLKISVKTKNQLKLSLLLFGYLTANFGPVSKRQPH